MPTPEDEEADRLKKLAEADALAHDGQTETVTKTTTEQQLDAMSTVLPEGMAKTQSELKPVKPVPENRAQAGQNAQARREQILAEAAANNPQYRTLSDVMRPFHAAAFEDNLANEAAARVATEPPAQPIVPDPRYPNPYAATAVETVQPESSQPQAAPAPPAVAPEPAGPPPPTPEQQLAMAQRAAASLTTQVAAEAPAAAEAAP
jgi:hypothetical protein